MATYHVERVGNRSDLAHSASQIIASNIELALEKKDRVQIALAGGSTPSATYALLGQMSLPWQRVDVFLGDERWVDPNDDSSNAKMIRNSLLSSGPGANADFHPVPIRGLTSPMESAKAYSSLIETFCTGTPPVFDLLLLGLGDDGHTASLFPYSRSLRVDDCWTTTAKGKGQERVTLTPNVLSSARTVLFLVSGSSKKDALKRLLDPMESPERTPAKLVKPSSQIIVIADEASTLFV